MPTILHEIRLGPLKATLFEDHASSEPYSWTVAKVGPTGADRGRRTKPLTPTEARCFAELIKRSDRWIREYVAQRRSQCEQQQTGDQSETAPERPSRPQHRKTHGQEI